MQFQSPQLVLSITLETLDTGHWNIIPIHLYIPFSPVFSSSPVYIQSHIHQSITLDCTLSHPLHFLHTLDSGRWTLDSTHKQTEMNSNIFYTSHSSRIQIPESRVFWKVELNSSLKSGDSRLETWDYRNTRYTDYTAIHVHIMNMLCVKRIHFFLFPPNPKILVHFSTFFLSLFGSNTFHVEKLVRNIE